MLQRHIKGRGWLPDPPDSRDYTFVGEAPGDVAELLANLRQYGQPESPLPERIDLRQHFEDPGWVVHDQGEFNTSSVFAAMGLVEFFERIARDRDTRVSCAFLYSAARKLAEARGDCGVCLRNCFKTMRRFGAPPEKLWPYDEQHLIDDPLDPFLFSFARDYSHVYYVRVSPHKSSGKKSLLAIRSLLAAGFAVACGFATPNRLPPDGDVPFRPDIHAIATGQAVVLIGFDDKRRIGAETGALLFRSSWGTSWGFDGYGWLPYAYVVERFAGDFWTLLRREWLDAGLATERIRCPAILE
jgi:C1A family cysteine protease